MRDIDMTDGLVVCLDDDGRVVGLDDALVSFFIIMMQSLLKFYFEFRDVFPR
jgi:hypothetical protein